MVVPVVDPQVVPHCDDAGCDLGALEYTCPVCSRFVRDYVAWWQKDGPDFESPCQACGATLLFRFCGSNV